MFIILATFGCRQNAEDIRKSIIANSIDSIKNHTTFTIPLDTGGGHGILYTCEDVHLNRDHHGLIYEEWIFADTLAKYCSVKELTDLSLNNESRAVRYIAFKLLLEKSPQDAVMVVVNDIDNNDSIGACVCDQSIVSLLSSMRVNLVQGNRKKYHVSENDSIAIDKAVMRAKERERFFYYEDLIKHRGYSGCHF